MSKKIKNSSEDKKLLNWSFLYNSIFLVMAYFFYKLVMDGGTLSSLDEKMKTFFPIFISCFVLASFLLFLGIKNSKNWYKTLNILSLIINILLIIGFVFLYNIFVARFFIS